MAARERPLPTASFSAATAQTASRQIALRLPLPSALRFADRRDEGNSIATWLRLHLTYLWRHRRPLALAAPLLFTELVQRRKLIDRDCRIPRWIDKLAAKHAVANILGGAWVTPTLWSGNALPDRPPCAPPFVLKSRHGCGQICFVRDEGEDWAKVRRMAASWMRRPYGRWLDEWGYRDVPRGLLIEPFLCSSLNLPIDYKLFVFHGRVRAIQVHLDRATRHRWVLFDPAWRPFSRRDGDRDIRPPASLTQMIAGAEALGRGFDFVRIDLYEVDGHARFGEASFYPGSGLEPIDPPELDRQFGRHWLGSAG
ncbi:ATP-grasp fold amidoligase family protein [Sphingomonas crusticola]|uniref:ATP-grasp fold amidoligase family protein n=1 Tax=Sphingomonas crusticola TaxID=1697973 RepID=UPI001F07E822|nr:ATP-grasp fold amidoligase family protein [Sphingomonas crusticola]